MTTDPNKTREYEDEVRQRWEPFRVTDMGHIADVVQGGGGKLSLTSADTGDIRKPRGQG
jgi:hypothetical protein